MEFDKIVGIDWSGAKYPKKSIQVAEYISCTNKVSLRQPSKGNWTRKEVWDTYFRQGSDQRTLIGVDFAFAYPYCDRDAYFPGHQQKVDSVTSIWAEVNRICDGQPDFYGGPFYKNPRASFACYLLYQKYTGQKYKRRFRQTEKACQSAKYSPSDVFKCVGASVGIGSIAGFRFLHKIETAKTATIWPFHKELPINGTTIVEIYPALFAKPSGVYRCSNLSAKQMEDALQHFDVRLASSLKDQSFSGDQRDALISAAGMKGWLDQKGPSAWDTSERSCTKYEGWIFGI